MCLKDAAVFLFEMTAKQHFPEVVAQADEVSLRLQGRRGDAIGDGRDGYGMLPESNGVKPIQFRGWDDVEHRQRGRDVANGAVADDANGIRYGADAGARGSVDAGVGDIENTGGEN